MSNNPDMAYGVFLDPDLKKSTSSSSSMDPWNAHQRVYDVDCHNKSSLYINHPHETIFNLNNNNSDIRQTHGIIPFPSSARFPRQSSPSDHQTSSTCSSSDSPLGESEYGFDHLPCTPPDDVDLSSSFQSQFLPWDSQGRFQELSGLCVKPGEVNFYQDSYQGYGDDRSPEFSGRDYSMSSHGTSYDIGSQHDQILMPGQMSPIDLSQDVQDEIRIPDQVNENEQHSYPPLNPDADEGVSEEDELEPRPAIQDDDDEDYKPSKPLKRSACNKKRNTNSRSRKRTSTSQRGSQTKKTKVEPKANYPCTECRDISFRDESSLDKHIKQQHTRPFVCVFGFAGCESTFAAKNEWKRHVASQHLLLNYWLCQQDSCSKLSNPPNNHNNRSNMSSQCSPDLPNGAIFNRKDLYTQHLRRMHIPPSIKKQVKQKKTVPEWEERIRGLQSEAYKLRCQLPHHMACPAPDCDVQFHGPNAWDDRMEHVAKHLERAAQGAEKAVVFGGDTDLTLVDWAASRHVSVVRRDAKGAWRLCNPLKPEKNMDEEDDEDAEGEVVDE